MTDDSATDSARSVTVGESCDDDGLSSKGVVMLSTGDLVFHTASAIWLSVRCTEATISEILTAVKTLLLQ